LWHGADVADCLKKDDHMRRGSVVCLTFMLVLE